MPWVSLAYACHLLQNETATYSQAVVQPTDKELSRGTDS
jgi:hypothetical protein